jgi:hypothetical protein
MPCQILPSSAQAQAQLEADLALFLFETDCCDLTNFVTKNFAIFVNILTMYFLLKMMIINMRSAKLSPA